MRSLVPALLALLFCCPCARAQHDSTVYHIRPWVDAPLCAAGGTALFLGLRAQADRSPLSMGTVSAAAADVDDIPALDRAALRIDPNGQRQALMMSDRILFGTAAAPLLLGLDPKIRKEYGPVMTMYLETATMVGGLQAWTCMATGRFRPITYIEGATMDQRTSSANTHSFFSGHTANTAAAAFFMAKVIDDMHPELGGKRWWLYGAAMVPTALVGYYRVEGGKHFPTDVITGACIGAVAGILVPQLHHLRAGKGGLSLLPIASPDMLGMHLSMGL